MKPMSALLRLPIKRVVLQLLQVAHRNLLSNARGSGAGAPIVADRYHTAASGVTRKPGLLGSRTRGFWVRSPVYSCPLQSTRGVPKADQARLRSYE